MRRLLFALALILTAAAPALAQTKTLITGTVIGSDGVPWTGAQLSGVLNSPGGPSPSFTPCNNPVAGCQIQQPVPPTVLGPGGTIQGLSLYSNVLILPAGTTYTFTVSTTGVPPPAGTGPQSCTLSGVTVVGPSQVLTFSGCPALTYASAASGATTISPLTYGAKWDVKFVYDAQYTSGSGTITCPNLDCNFTATDVGKIVMGFESPYSQNQGSSLSTLYQTLITCGAASCPTIGTVNNPNSITLAGGATAANSCVPSAANLNVCTLAWGTQDDTAAINIAAQAAFNTPGKCLPLVFPAGAAFFSSPIVNNTLAQMSSACGGQQGTTGGLDLTQSGPVVWGQGPQASILIPLPYFNYSACTAGVSGQGCTFAVPNLAAHDFGVNGLGNGISASHTVSLVELDGSVGGAGCTGSTGWDLDLSNWGVQFTGSIGFDIGRNACGDPVYWNNVTELFGARNCQITIQQQLGFFYNACFGATDTPLNVLVGNGAQFSSYGGYYLTPYNVTSHNIVTLTFSGSGSTATFNNDFLNNLGFQTGAFNGLSIGTGSTGGTVYLRNVLLQFGSGNTVTSNCIAAAFASSAAVNIHIFGSTLSCAGANNRTFNTVSPNNVVDDGGNVITDGSVASSIAGGYASAPGNSIKGVCTGTATSSSTLALRITGVATTATAITSACTSTTLDGGLAVNGTGRTLQHLNVTASTGGVSASSGVVTVLRNGAATTITCTIGTGTSCNDFVHDVSVNDGDLISFQFTTQAAETLAGVKATVEWN